LNFRQLEWSCLEPSRLVVVVVAVVVVVVAKIVKKQNHLPPRDESHTSCAPNESYATIIITITFDNYN